MVMTILEANIDRLKPAASHAISTAVACGGFQSAN